VRCEVLLFWAMTRLKVVTDVSAEDTDTNFRKVEFYSETVVPTYKIIRYHQQENHNMNAFNVEKFEIFINYIDLNKIHVLSQLSNFSIAKLFNMKMITFGLIFMQSRSCYTGSTRAPKEFRTSRLTVDHIAKYSPFKIRCNPFTKRLHFFRFTKHKNDIKCSEKFCTLNKMQQEQTT
jgi:hypothetical protein